MSRTPLLLLCAVIGLLIIACAKSDDTNRNATPTTATVSGEPIGVPECDNFLNAYETCISTKVPEIGRPQFQTVMATWRANWKQLAANPQTKPGLVQACKDQHERARTQMQAYGCTF
jgi:hypothetical protein